MKCVNFKNWGLKSKLIASHLSIAFVSFLILLFVLMAVIWLKRITDSVFLISAPITNATREIEHSLHSSTSALRGWVAVKNPEYMIDRQSAWNKGVLPNLNKLERLSIQTNNKPLAKMTKALKGPLIALKMWQWRVEDAARSYGDNRARYFMGQHLTPSSTQLIDLSTVLIDEEHKKTRSTSDMSVVYFLSRFNDAFNQLTKGLSSYILLDDKQGLERARKNLLKAEYALADVAKLKHSFTSQQKNILLTLKNKLHHFPRSLNQLISLKQNSPKTLSGYWLSHKVTPLFNKIGLQLKAISNKELAIQKSNSSTLTGLVDFIFYGICFFVLFLFFLSFYLARSNAIRILSPVILLLNATKRLAAGESQSNIPVESDDEIGRLTQSFNEMRAQQNLAEQKIKAIVETAIDPILTINSQGIIVTCNSATGELLGYTVDELIGNNIKMLMPEPYRGEHDEYLNRYLTTGVKKIIGISRELEALTKAGELIPVFLSVSEIILPGERLFTGIMRDLSDTKRREKEALEMEKQIQRTQKLESIGQLAGGLAHDINNILNAISGYTNLQNKLLSNSDSNTQYGKKIKLSIKRASTITQQLLNYAHKNDIKMIQFNVNTAIEEAVELLEHSINKKIKVSLNLAQRLAPIKADETQLIQVFLNLGLNAAAVMSDGGLLSFTSTSVHVSYETIKKHPDLKKGDYILVTVHDDGTGMSADTLSKLFDPFFTTKKIGEGTGLGLSVVYGIMRDHSAICAVDSTEGVGTTFSLYFPALTCENRPLKANDTVTKDQDKTHIATVLHKKTILIADDEDMLLELFDEYLYEFDCNVLLAHNGQEAIELFKKHQQDIDLILMDIRMPEMNGYDAMKHIHEINPKAKVIFLSGYSEEKLSTVFKDKSHVGFLSKPYEVEDLLVEMSKYLEKDI
jgi:PAS domain S-box-containing protein